MDASRVAVYESGRRLARNALRRAAYISTEQFEMETGTDDESEIKRELSESACIERYFAGGVVVLRGIEHGGDC